MNKLIKSLILGIYLISGSAAYSDDCSCKKYNWRAGQQAEKNGNYKSAVIHYEQGCFNGWVNCCSRLQELYAKGIGVKQNKDKADEYEDLKLLFYNW